jgi:(p)ppGpp synthase/HD superfamily hydrolase
MNTIETLRAETIARLCHAGQIEESTGDPYIRHVERVVAMVDWPAKPAAWLHDVLEDCEAVNPESLLAAGISQSTISSVICLTRASYSDRCGGETYAHYIDRLKASGDAVAIEVKIADLRDHFRPNCPPRLRPRYEAAWAVLVGTAVPG